MLFAIVFNEYGATLDTADMETAFHACDIPQLVQAVVNAETGKVLWGSLSDPEKDLELEKVQAKKRLYDMEHKTPCTRLTAEDIMRKHRENKVGGITRSITTVHGVKQYDTAIVIPMPREWQVITRADIPTQAFYTMFEQYATKRFDRALSSMWGYVPFYNEVRLYHNGILVRAGVEGKEITL